MPSAGVLALVFAAASIACALLLAPLVAWLRRGGVLDHPNLRSLHRAPTPRGGGLAIVIVTAGAHLWLLDATREPVLATWSAVAAGFGLLGWSDDRNSRSVRLRLAVQVVMAGVFVAVVSWRLGVHPGPWPLLGALLAIVAVVWAVNLYNFMDGADGFAATHAALVMLGVLCLPGLGRSAEVTVVATVLGGACVGFLAWNRPPARVFMGDVGSYFVGFELAALATVDVLGGASPWAWAILLLPFVVDTSLTLLRRLVRGERWWSAHREHAFQRLLLGGWNPWQLLAALATLDIAVCWPLAAWAGAQPARAPLALALAAAAVVGCWSVAARSSTRRA